MATRPSVVFAAGAVTALVLGSGTAYAATGGTFILGRSNVASTTTSLNNGAGTALALSSKAGTPPLAVNSTTRVGRLNVDLLDGKDSTQFALSGARPGTITASGFYDEVVQVTVAYAECPAGSLVMGGGFIDRTANGIVIQSSVIDNGWLVLSSNQVEDQVGDVYAQARCYNPRAVVADASQDPAPERLSPQAEKMVAQAEAGTK